MKTPLTILCALLLMFAAGPLNAQASAANAEPEVLAVVNALFDGMRTADSAMVRPLFHQKARLITVDLRSEGRPARIDDNVDGFIRSIGGPRTEVFDERIFNVKTQIDGSLASVWADYKFYRGTTLNHCGVDHFLLVKESGAWKIIELSDTRRTASCG